MPATTDAHPEKDQLVAFGLGKLDAAAASQIEQHLEACPDCCSTILNLQDDTFVGLVRVCQPASAAPDQSGVTLAVAAGSAAAHPAAAELPPALQAHDRYVIQELIGRGGMGDVYRAQHKVMNRQVALKVIKPQLVRNEAAVQRFRREVQAAASLHHKHIVTAYDAEQAGELHFLVMEFVPGVNLDEVIRERGPLPVAEACNYIRQAAEGLQHAHELGMVHRDIKPHNLMVTKSGEVKILDFGLASFATEVAEEEIRADSAQSNVETAAALHQLTQMGTMMGTPDYIAPEQAANAHKADIRADIYSLGCTLFTLLAGKAPFGEGSVLEKIKAHAQAEPPAISQFRSDVPPQVAAILRKMLAKDPAERYQTPAEVVAALERWAAVASPVAAAKPARTRRWPLVLTAVAGVLAAIAAGVIFYIATDTGQLEIDSDAAIPGARIVLIKDGQEYATFEVEPGSKRQTIRAGEYEIALRGAPAVTSLNVRSTKRGEPHDFGSPVDPKDKVFAVYRGGGMTIEVARRPGIAMLPEGNVAAESVGHWTPLFNGRDLTGWKMQPDKPGNWRVENGVLIGGKFDGGSEEENSFLDTEKKDFTNFHLRLEAKLNPGAADAGVMFDFGGGSWAEANIAFNPSKRDQYVGSIMVAGTKPNGVTWQAAPRDLASPDQWFTLEVIALGQQITTKVNGKVAAVHTQRKQTTGPIRLQDHGPFTVVEFRKIEVIELDEQGKPLHQDEFAFVRMFKGHESPVLQIASSPDGKRAISLSEGVAYFWDIPSGRLLNKSTAVGAGNKSASNRYEAMVSPDGRHAVVRGAKVTLWDMESHELVKTLLEDPGSGDAFASVSFSPNGRLLAVSVTRSAPRPQQLRVFGTEDWNEIYSVDGSRGGVFSPDSRWVFTGRGNDIALLDASNGQLVRTLSGLAGVPVYGFFSSDGSLLAAEDATYKSPRVWETETGTLLPSWSADEGAGIMAIFANNTRMLTNHHGSAEQAVRDLKTGRVLARLQGHRGRIHSTRVLPDERHVITGSFDETIRIWSLTTGKEVFRVDTPGWSGTNLSISPDGRSLLSGGGYLSVPNGQLKAESFDIQLWRLPESVWPATSTTTADDIVLDGKLSGHTSAIKALRFLAEDKQFVSIGADAKLRKWNLATKEAEITELGDRGSIGDADFSAAGDLAAITSPRVGSTLLWDVAAGKERTTISDPAQYPERVLLSRNGAFVLLSGTPGQAVLRDAKTGAELQSLQMREPRLGTAVLSSDGRLALLAEGRVARLMQTVNGKLVRGYGLFSQSESCAAAFSFDGAKFAIGHSDGTISLWNATNHDPLNELNRSTEYTFKDGKRIDHALESVPHRVTHLQFISGDRFLLAAFDNGALRVWAVEGGKLTARCDGPAGCAREVALSLDGKSLLTGGGEVWNQEQGKLVSTANNDIYLWRLPASVWPQPEKIGRNRDFNVGAKKLIGQWKSTDKEAKSWIASVEFQADGKLSITGEFDGQTHEVAGTYKVDGYKLFMNIGDQALDEEVTIFQLTDEVLVAAAKNGKKLNFERVAEKKGEM